MPKFSKTSLDKLSTCTANLQKVFNFVIQHIDFRVTEGHRGKEAQDKAFKYGNSKLKWPNGNHNSLPSTAVDALVMPVDFNTADPKILGRYYYFAGYVKGVADHMGIPLRTGADWDGDLDFKDQTFDDMVHFEEVIKK